MDKIDILAFGAHPDDVELGASGTIIKQISQGKKVVICDLTKGELGSRGDENSRTKESKIASEIMGINERINLSLKDGFFEETKENIIKIIEIIRHYKPKITIITSPNDRHPDHGRSTKLILRASFLSGLIKIKTQFNNIDQEPHRTTNIFSYIQDIYHKPDFVVDITEFWNKKMDSILAYKTQFYNIDSENHNIETPISSKEFLSFLEGRALQFGRLVNCKYGEGFISHNPLLINDFDNIF